MELKVGVVGCGAIGREHIARLGGKLQRCRVVAVSDVFEEGARQAGGPFGARVYTDSAALVNDPEVDAVVVTAASFAHKDILLQCIAAGKPAFCEKPLAKTADDCRAVMAAEMAFGRKLVQVGFMRRFDKGYRQVKALLDRRACGEPLILHCTHRNPSVADDYDTSMAVSETVIHEIDVLHWLLGDEYESVQVMIPRSTKNTNPAVLRDPQLMLLRTKGGVCIEVEVFVNCRFGYDIECEVVCEEGAIQMPEPPFPMMRAGGARTTPIEMDWKTRFIEAYDVELQEWVDATLRGEVCGPTAWDGFHAAVTADALIASQASGKAEPVPAGGCPAFYA